MGPIKPHVSRSTGFRFEMKMTAFTALRLHQTSEEFYLESNKLGCGNWDDIVYSVLGSDGKWAAWFVQIKHKLESDIKAGDLLGDWSEDFALNKYYPSFESLMGKYEDETLNYHKIFGRQIEEKHFVIFTNAPLHINNRKIRNKVPIIFRTSNEEGFKFNIESHESLLKKISEGKLLAQFTKSFILCAGQCNETWMITLIQKEIAKIYGGLTTNEIELVMWKWIKFIEDWSKGDEPLTKSWLVTQLKDIVAQVLIDKKNQINVVFLPEYCGNWKKTLTNEDEKLIYMTIDAPNTQLAMALLKQIGLTTYPNTELSIEHFLSNSPTQQTGILVIDCPSDFIYYDEKLAELREKQVNRVILVSTIQNNAARQMANILQFQPTQLKCSLWHLTGESRNIFLKRNFLFQGRETDLSQVITTNLKLFNASMLTNFCANLTDIGNKLPEEIPFYVPRMLERKTQVSQDFFNHPTQSRFGLINTDRSLCNNPRIIHLKDEGEFEKYAIDDAPFHMFEAEKKRNTYEYKWLKSSKNVQEVAARLKSESTIEKRDNILQISENIILITGRPGIGKSTLLLHLAVATKNYCPNYWIIMVPLADYKAYFLRKNFSGNVVKELIIAAAGIDPKNKFHVEFFDYCCQSGQIILLLDGFDEINVSNGLKMLDVLRQVPLARLCISASSTSRAQLEDHLNVLSYTIKPFTKPDQKIFLKKIWQLDECGGNYIDETLKSVAEFQQFTGIPSHMRMIAEVCDPAKSEAGRLNAVELFEEFIKLKRQAFVDKLKPIMPAYALAIVAADHEEEVTSLALLALLPLETCAKLDPPVKDIEGLKQFITDGTSVVLSFNKKPNFIHPTFAEFYAARYFYQHFPTNRDFLTSGQFFEKNFEFVRYFLDRFLAKGCLLHEAVFAHDFKAVELLLRGGTPVNAVDRGGRTALHIAAGVPDSASVILVLIKAGANVDLTDRILGWAAVQYAMKAGLNENYGPLIEHSKRIEEGSLEVLSVTWNALLFAIRGDYFKTFMHLLYHGLSNVEDLEALRPRNWINGNVQYSLTILHLAAAHNAKKILKHLLRRDVPDSKWHLIAKPDQNGLTALLWAAKCGHSESLQILLNAGANLFNETNDKKTVAIYALENRSSEILLTFLAGMRKCKLKAVKYLRDVIVKLIEDVSEWAVGMFSYLITIYPELILVTSKCNMSLLSTACIVGNDRIVKRLLDLGADTTKITPRGSVLHLAVIAGSKPVVELLLEKNVAVDVPDAESATPIYWAAERGFDEIFFLLVNAGANLEITTENKENLAHAAARSAQPDICQFLIRKGIDFRAVNSFAETGLMLLERNEARGLVNLLEKQFAKNSFPLQEVQGRAPRNLNGAASSTGYVKENYKATNRKTKAKTSAII